MKKMSFLLAAFLLMILAACGNGDGSGGTPNADGANTEDATDDGGSEGEDSAAGDDAEGTVSGSVGIDGSSTVFPIMEAVSEEFQKEFPEVQAPIGVSGTGGGFEKFIAGETDISNASRPISEEEVAALEEAGIEYTEFEIAYDGISVVVNSENDWVDQLTVEELQSMWLEEGGATTWADVREGWPAEPIQFYSPGTDSGTFDYWNEVILEEQQIRKDVVLSENDNTLVQGVVGNKNAVSYFGYAYYLENQDTLNIVPIVNEAGEAVEPNEDTIASGDYNPLSRPMFIYVNNASLAEKPQVYEYVMFALENAGTLSEEVGYVGSPQEVYDEAISTANEIAGQ
ncbi:PstS family phosphate ABC transporter substrate-binding protein [Aureibacillus halotolerans]|uniref:Phosphate-binding protein n=1 Tax=Aureibacillus halotolerans TaxID=1508390 RepID=A0A4V3D684_9BACI|nr:PstS family phosphate ABC transporter substrate-binding protein [Aureibacillus halotolerans]TDQ42987.1 phosphate ABC transporter substrate-binding protein (PhoT family) [Aureibacillus halotolerans]